MHPAVVRIVAPGKGSISYGSGTLVYVGDQVGLVITNWHVINEAAGPISVHFPDGFYSIGTVQKMDHDWDLAVLVIRKPNVASVPIAATPPRPGEMLTIAGYGSGNYRAASGPCTQYVAPGTTFPFEMIECAVSARQGDSGGPIFNSRGELAGVLFGEGQGRTAGSYCGRVRWFLSSVVPEGRDNPSMIAVAPLKPISPRPTALPFDRTQLDPRPSAASQPGMTPCGSPRRRSRNRLPIPFASTPMPVNTRPCRPSSPAPTPAPPCPVRPIRSAGKTWPAQLSASKSKPCWPLSACWPSFCTR